MRWPFWVEVGQTGVIWGNRERVSDCLRTIGYVCPGFASATSIHGVQSVYHWLLAPLLAENNPCQLGKLEKTQTLFRNTNSIFQNIFQFVCHILRKPWTTISLLLKYTYQLLRLSNCPLSYSMHAHCIQSTDHTDLIQCTWSSGLNLVSPWSLRSA